MTYIKVENLTQRFGGIVALNDISCQIQQGEIVGIIGPNGAGKTTLFNCLTGVYSPTSGTITYHDQKDIVMNGKSMDAITNLGLARTFQNIRLFKSMSVIDNIKIAMNASMQYTKLEAILRTKRFYREERLIEERALQLLDIVDLRDKAFEKADALSYGEQRRLEIGRALATGARFIFLDEPAAGMNPQETKDLTAFIRRIHDSLNLTITLIEHDMGFVMDLCNRIYVLNYGQCIAEGAPAEIQTNQVVIDAYLGVDETEGSHA